MRYIVGKEYHMQDIVPQSSPDVPISVIIDRAVSSGVPVETLERLMGLAERLQDRNAASAFQSAMAAFQAECPPIRKNARANIATRGGANYGYTFATLDQIARTVRPLLHKHGLAYSWDSKTEGGTLTCVCTVRHIDGHAVTATFACPVDSAAAMSGAQKQAAALTYARRQSLVQALGLTTTDDDTDGADDAPAPTDDGPKITDHQAANLGAALDELGVKHAAFCEAYRIGSLAELPASKWDHAMKAVERKRQQAGGKA